jgi:hypothetical protein
MADQVQALLENDDKIVTEFMKTRKDLRGGEEKWKLIMVSLLSMEQRKKEPAEL